MGRSGKVAMRGREEGRGTREEGVEGRRGLEVFRHVTLRCGSGRVSDCGMDSANPVGKEQGQGKEEEKEQEKEIRRVWFSYKNCQSKRNTLQTCSAETRGGESTGVVPCLARVAT